MRRERGRFSGVIVKWSHKKFKTHKGTRDTLKIITLLGERGGSQPAQKNSQNVQNSWKFFCWGFKKSECDDFYGLSLGLRDQTATLFRKKRLKFLLELFCIFLEISNSNPHSHLYPIRTTTQQLHCNSIQQEDIKKGWWSMADRGCMCESCLCVWHEWTACN